MLISHENTVDDPLPFLTTITVSFRVIYSYIFTSQSLSLFQCYSILVPGNFNGLANLL